MACGVRPPVASSNPFICPVGRSSTLCHCSSRKLGRSSGIGAFAFAARQVRGQAFDLRGVALRSHATRVRAHAAVARLWARLRRPAAAPPPPYERRELCTELGMVAAFLVAAVAAAVTLPRSGFSPLAALVLGVLLVVVLAVEFDVAEGRTSPVQLVLLPMLVLVPPAFVPLVVASAHVVHAFGT